MRSSLRVEGEFHPSLGGQVSLFNIRCYESDSAVQNLAFKLGQVVGSSVTQADKNFSEIDGAHRELSRIRCKLRLSPRGGWFCRRSLGSPQLVIVRRLGL